MEKITAIGTIIVFAMMIFGCFAVNLAYKPPVHSASERRDLAVMPAFNADSVLSGTFMNKFEGYAADSFVGRDTLRGVKAGFTYFCYQQTDNGGIYVDGAIGAGKFERLNKSAADKAGRKMAVIAGMFPQSKIYWSFIPDKSAYGKRDYPGYNVEEAREIIGNSMDGYTYIDIANAITGDMFYKSDLHWNQIKLQNALNVLADGMGFVPQKLSDMEKVYAGDFAGVYKGQVALPIETDQMYFLNNAELDNVTATYLADDGSLKSGSIYNFGSDRGFTSEDPYNLFLSGIQPMITLTNNSPAVTNDRNLIVFRDSFTSSLAPLLALSYKSVTLVDLRSIDSRVLSGFLSDSGKNDVLFLYSSQVINNSDVLKVDMSKTLIM